MEFKTDRFIVRKLRLEDIDEFYDMQSSENVMRYIKAPLNYEESLEELQKFIGYYSGTSRYFLLWAIEDKRNGDFFGICGVYHNNKVENEIAYRLREQFWGKGIGSEIAKSLIQHCLGQMELGKIVAHADEDNIGSVKILEREMRFVEREYSEERKCYSRKYEISSGFVI